MEDIKQNKQLLIVIWIFIIVSIVHILYATITMRGMYLDACAWMVKLLDNMANNHVATIKMSEARSITVAIPQIPVLASYFLLGIKNKTTLVMIYCFSQFFLPFLFLGLHYKLTIRTKKYEVFLLNLFVYCAVLIPFSIFSVVETLIGATLQFILWNYLVSDIEYKKTDLIWITLLSVTMYEIYEYTIFLSPLFLLAAILKAKKETRKKEKITKLLIGFSFIGVGCYILCHTLKSELLLNATVRFLGEMTDYFSRLFELNSLISITTILLIIIFLFKKSKIGNWSFTFLSLVFIGTIWRLLQTLPISLVPMWEQHLRTIPCWLLPIIFVYMLIAEKFNLKLSNIKYQNILIIILLCGIMQSSWQIVNSYYWDKNVKYMKKELKKCPNTLYIPSEHPEISSFFNNHLRRHIWHSVYAPMSIIFSPNYEQKTLLVNYDHFEDEGNLTFRERLYVIDDSKMSIPFGYTISIKNKFWDLTNCAKDLDKHNKINNIKTDL